MKTQLIMILLLLLSTFNALSMCTESLEQEEQALLKMKTELICQNSLSECQDLIVKIDGIASFGQNECTDSDVKIEDTLPLIPDFLFGMAAIASEIDGAEKRQYVNSVVDFYHHTQLHKKRVVELAAHLVEKFPEEFKGIDKEMVTRILSVHDDAKIGHNYRFTDGKTYYEKLYEYYGKRPPMEVINGLNGVDKSIMRQIVEKELFQLTHKMSLEDATKFKEEFVPKLSRLENLADFVDRAMNPVSAEEFGRQMFLESESNTSKDDAAYKKMALYLEQNYKKIVPELMYKKLSPLAALNISKSMKINSLFYKISNNSKAAIGTIAARSSKILASMSLKKIGLTRAAGVALAVATSAPADAALLLTFSTPTACSELGSHEWTYEGGKCQPLTGYSDRFISMMTESDVNHDFGPKSTTCNVFKSNLEVNETSPFLNISCQPKSAKLEFSKHNFIEPTFGPTGKIKEVFLKNINEFSDEFFSYSAKVIYNNNSEPVKVCKFKPDMSSWGSFTNSEGDCEDISDYESFQGTKLGAFLSTMNYKMVQSVGCCLGVKNEFNEKITCTI